MTERYSFLSLARHAFSAKTPWERALRQPSLRNAYEVVIVGGGGHGLATAYFLAKEHGLRNVAVLERGAIGQGNSGRNTQVVRSDYYHLASSKFFERSLQLYEGLSRELNYNIMLSQRGKVSLVHSPHEMELARRTVNAIRMNGVDAEIVTARELAKLEPMLNLACRFPIEGAAVQWRGGISRHDAVVWAFARGADRLGVEIHPYTEVTGMERSGDRITAVETNRGRIECGQVVSATAGWSSLVSGLAGMRLPITTHILQAFVTEPMKPFLDVIIVSSQLHVYVSQLRHKLEPDPARPRYIVTEPGVGYRLVSPAPPLDELEGAAANP